VSSAGHSGRKICLVTSGPISSNPRIVKEAGALAEAGLEVVVVGLQTMQRLQPFDRDLACSQRWRYAPVEVFREAGIWTYRARTARERLLQLLPAAAWAIGGVVEGAFNRYTDVLEAALMQEPAQMYIAHNLAALPAAAAAAERFGACLGFDAEDYHAGELPDTPEYAKARRRVLAIEDRYIPRCRHLTAASPEIADLYVSRYARPVTSILNVFPLSERPVEPVRQAAGSAPSLYWFSQTIGPGRGLEQMTEIVSLMRTRPSLHLRGTFAAGFQERLNAMAARRKISERLHILPRAAPGEMVGLAAGHSLGLSIETDETLNRRACLTNKIFTYLLAGVPVVLSDTPAQQRLAGELGEAAQVFRLGDAPAAAAALDEWLSSDDRLSRSRTAAWRLGEQRYNWDREKDLFLASVNAALAAQA
jgi:glycosyltransferase involved in cell wall biosynthesis